MRCKAQKKMDPNRTAQKVSKTGALSKREETGTVKRVMNNKVGRSAKELTIKITNRRLQRTESSESRWRHGRKARKWNGCELNILNNDINSRRSTHMQKLPHALEGAEAKLKEKRTSIEQQLIKNKNAMNTAKDVAHLFDSPNESVRKQIIRKN